MNPPRSGRGAGPRAWGSRPPRCAEAACLSLAPLYIQMAFRCRRPNRAGDGAAAGLPRRGPGRRNPQRPKLPLRLSFVAPACCGRRPTEGRVVRRHSVFRRGPAAGGPLCTTPRPLGTVCLSCCGMPWTCRPVRGPAPGHAAPFRGRAGGPRIAPGPRGCPGGACGVGFSSRPGPRARGAPRGCLLTPRSST